MARLILQQLSTIVPGRFSLSLALALTAFIPGAIAVAQKSGVAPSAHRAAPNYKHPALDERVKALAKNLKLSKSQQSAVKRILEERYQEILQLRTDPSLSGADRIAIFRGLQKDTVEKIRGVLNEGQKKRYDPLAPRKLPRAPQQKSVEDWLKATEHKNSK